MPKRGKRKIQKGGGNVFSSENEWKKYIISIDDAQYIVDKIALEDVNSKYKSVQDLSKDRDSLDQYVLTDFITLEPLEAKNVISICLFQYFILDPMKHRKLASNIFEDIHIFPSNHLDPSKYHLFDINSLYTMLYKEYLAKKRLSYKIHNKEQYVNMDYVVFESFYYDVSLFWKIEQIYKNIYRQIESKQFKIKIIKNIMIYYDDVNKYIRFDDDITKDDVLFYKSKYSQPFNKSYLKDHLYKNLQLESVENDVETYDDFFNIDGYIKKYITINNVHHYFHAMMGVYIMFDDDLRKNDIVIYKNQIHMLKNDYEKHVLYNKIMLYDMTLYSGLLSGITAYKKSKINSLKPVPKYSISKKLLSLKSLPPKKSKTLSR
jgi:hypothetical protein